MRVLSNWSVGNPSALFAALAATLLTIATTASAQPSARYEILPSAVDPAVEEFDRPHMVIRPTRKTFDAPLVVFLPGSNGWGANTASMLEFAASRGYRAIGLTFVAAPSIAQVCPRDPDPDCARKFRQMRTYATGDFSEYRNSYADSVVGRLVALLRHLHAEHGNQGWDRYLDGDRPRWDRIVVSGQSQGGGMAALIAKEHLVNRVVLFSPGWDTTGRPRRPAPWLLEDSATPPERWFGAFHLQEGAADLLEGTYAALAIPADQIVRFDRELPEPFASRNRSRNPFHVIGMRDPRYEPEWTMMFGDPDDFPPAD